MHRWAGRLCACAAVAVVVMSTTVVADEVDDVLTAWAEHLANAPTKCVHGMARQYTYDSVFLKESRQRVEFWMESSIAWRVDFVPQHSWAGPSKKRNAQGDVYQIEPTTKFERWVLRNDGLAQLVGDSQERPFGRRTAVVRDEDDALTRWIKNLVAPTHALQGCAIPFQLACLGLDLKSQTPGSGRSRADWSIRLGPAHGKKGQIHLVMIPESAEISSSFSRIDVLLQEADYSPIGVRWFDPGGTLETVLAIEQLEREGVAEALDPWEVINWPPRCEWISHYGYGQDRPPAPPSAR